MIIERKNGLKIYVKDENQSYIKKIVRMIYK